MDSPSKSYNIASLQEDFPDKIPDWDFSEDMGALDQFMDDMPSFNFDNADETIPPGAADTTEYEQDHSTSSPTNEGPSRKRSRSPDLRRQQQNKHAQQRMRQRQKVAQATMGHCLCQLSLVQLLT